MRIIAGQYRGRKLAPVSVHGIRPTSDRVREAVFNIISHRVAGARILDLFAGTGALGLEALSRGAAHAVFVESAPTACHLIRENIRRCRAGENTHVVQHEISPQPSWPGLLAHAPYTLVFMDPPYGTALLKTALTSPFLAQILSPEGMVIAEHSLKEPLPSSITTLDIQDQRKYGKTLISFLTPASGGKVQ